DGERFEAATLAETHGVFDRQLFEEWFHCGGAVFVHGDADDFDAFGCHLLVKLVERRNFFAARHTPRGPVVQHDGFAFAGGGGERCAVECQEGSTVEGG